MRKSDVLTIGFVALMSLFFLESFALMLALGGVWHETGWGQPVSYAGAVTLTGLAYVLKFIWSGFPGIKSE